jgi:hypothetical protein
LGQVTALLEQSEKDRAELKRKYLSVGEKMEQLLKQDDAQSAHIHSLAIVKEQQLNAQIEALRKAHKRDDKRAKKQITAQEEHIQALTRYAHLSHGRRGASWLMLIILRC